LSRGDGFKACFSSWAPECWPDKPGLVAIDGKTSYEPDHAGALCMKQH
jgi:hypothetical protein